MDGKIVAEYFSEKRPNYEKYTNQLNDEFQRNECNHWLAEATYNGIEVIWHNRIMFAMYYIDKHCVRICSTGMVPDDYVTAFELVQDVSKELGGQ